MNVRLQQPELIRSRGYLKRLQSVRMKLPLCVASPRRLNTETLSGGRRGGSYWLDPSKSGDLELTSDQIWKKDDGFCQENRRESWSRMDLSYLSMFLFNHFSEVVTVNLTVFNWSHHTHMSMTVTWTQLIGSGLQLMFASVSWTTRFPSTTKCILLLSCVL